MNATKALARQPMIRFLGKRVTPQDIDHTPHVHPASPTNELPSSFKAYRKKAQQHGPLNHIPSVFVGGHIGGSAGRNLGPVEAGKGFYFDRSELPQRFQPASLTLAEMELLESGGASQFA
ncbi:hypothetical protein CFE70_007042 [Pyrenophora teres f. teres 0-1]|uniref:Uncharacterized protein n=2 Tax=Pyrenophora teres f. teres TaxID=97479 RepID=E3RU39_PYRTT|nr:hypothetical protein PTT_12579 [Pyrenophora teres f. teres 0-1]KAE8822275.1 hypothetical protein HRS9139_10296 [Pyrenophora teres f. teres]CAA9964300.1 S36 mt domain containing protein [Pyrenophora teres f. maculata]KAE8835062.1 hypothetical protein PTNB85_06395 [Pyrenophora teres f. teres]KAE8843462.1 hypothetical protein HRS9122_04565 [Pyrenophora teres f. teres]